MRHRGAVAPGYDADLVLLDDARACGIREVYSRGRPVSDLDLDAVAAPKTPNSIRAVVPEARDLEGPAGRVHVIGVRAGRILTDRHVMDSDAPGVARLSVLERYGRGSRPANGYVTGFGEKFDGAIASSVGHDSHNLIVAGRRTEDMRAALAGLAECGGGYCVARKGQVVARLPLPFGGLMSLEGEGAIVKQLGEMHEASRAVGCELPEPFLQLAFLSLPVIPSLKLTDKGLVDVEKFAFLEVRAS
jgi:adenine deaminase